MIKGSFSSDFIEEVRSKSDIVDVASKYITLNRRGGSFWACCPFHHEKTPSFSIKPDGQFYKCFGCGESGNVFSLVMKMENVDFITAVEMLAKENNIPIPTQQENEEMRLKKQQREKMYQILKATSDFYYNNLQNYPNSKQAQYVASRGLNAQTIQKFKIGISLNFDSLIPYLKKLNFSEADMISAGVVGKNDMGLYDFYGGRVIFPIFNSFGDVVAFSGRSIEQAPEHTKYKNTPQSLIFNKSDILFGYNFARELKKEHLLDTLIIVEGHIDVIMCHQAGVTNVIGCMGTALTPLHAKNIKRLVDNVILCLDGDNAGALATKKAIDILKQVGLNVKVTRLELAKDPDEFIKKFGANNFVEQLNNAMDCVDFVLMDAAKKYDLNKNADKTNYIAEALNYISKFSTPAEQEVYLKEVQQLVKIPMDALRKSLVQTGSQPKTEDVRATKTENVPNNYLIESKIMLLASMLYKKVDNFENFSGLFTTDDELSELYKFILQKKQENKDFNVSTLFDNFDIVDKSLIDRVINYVFPSEDVFTSFLQDTIKRVKLYELKQEKQRYTTLLSNAKTDSEKVEYLTKIQELTEKINKENL